MMKVIRWMYTLTRIDYGIVVFCWVLLTGSFYFITKATLSPEDTWKFWIYWTCLGVIMPPAIRVIKFLDDWLYRWHLERCFRDGF